MAQKIKLDQKTKTVVVSADISIDSPLLFELLDKTSNELYDDRFIEALNLGSYGLLLDENAHMLDAAARDIDGRLTTLRKIFEIRGLRIQGTSGGAVVEEDAIQILRDHADRRSWTDLIDETGNKIGALPGRKVGDILIDLQEITSKIVVESKMDKSLSLSDYGMKSDSQRDNEKLEKTVFGQALLGLANRKANIAIHLANVNNCHTTLKKGGALQIFPEIPVIVALVNPSSGDWSALIAAYEITRALSYAWEVDASVQWDKLPFIFERIRREIQILQGMHKVINQCQLTARKLSEDLSDLADTLGEITDDLSVSEESIEMLFGSLDWIKNKNISIPEQMKTFFQNPTEYVQ
jgi:hypothetical protein